MPTEVAILFADLTNSHEFGEVTTSERYNEVIRRFQILAHQLVGRFREDNHTGDRLYAEMVNDNLLAVIGGDSAAVDILNLSLALKRSWNESELAAELRRFHQSPSFPVTMDMSIGLSQGPVEFGINIFSNNIEPDGSWISRTKRIRRLAEEYALNSLILVTEPIREAAINANLGFTFGDPMNLDPGEKTLLKFDPNSGLYVLYPVLNFPQTTVAA